MNPIAAYQVTDDFEASREREFRSLKRSGTIIQSTYFLWIVMIFRAMELSVVTWLIFFQGLNKTVYDT